MGQDKGSLVLFDNSEDQRSRCYRLLSKVCDCVFISCRESQAHLIKRDLPIAYDSTLLSSRGGGPGVGILSAFQINRNAAWLVLACDMPNVDSAAIRYLVEQRHEQPNGQPHQKESKPKCATLFADPETGILQPLFAIWEPSALLHFESEFMIGHSSPRKSLETLECQILAVTHSPLKQGTLKNLNSNAVD